MRRLFWIVLGAVVGVLVVRKITRTAEALTPSALGRTLTRSAESLADTARGFAGDVRAAMVEREAELTAALQENGGQWGARPPDDEG